MSLAHPHEPAVSLDDVAGNDDLLDVVTLPGAAPDRPRVLLVGTSFACIGVVMAFALLMGVYIAARENAHAAGQTWIKAGTITLTGPDIALFTLLLSVVTMRWAVYSVTNADRQNTWVAVGLTVLLGAAFVNATTFIYGEMGLGLTSSVMATLVYTITGAHLVLVAVALLFVLVAAFRTLGTQDTSPARETMTAAALLWYTTCGVFFVIWYAIYIIK